MSCDQMRVKVIFVFFAILKRRSSYETNRSLDIYIQRSVLDIYIQRPVSFGRVNRLVDDNKVLYIIPSVHTQTEVCA